MPKLKTIRAFEEWKKDEAAIEALLQRIAGGVKLQAACLEIRRPYTLVYPFLHSTPELQKRYEGALAARAEALVHESLEIADSVRGSLEPAKVAAAKLAVETRQRTATWWNRERYGERFSVDKTVVHVVDAGLVGRVGDLLELTEKSPVPLLEHVVEGEKVEEISGGQDAT